LKKKRLRLPPSLAKKRRLTKDDWEALSASLDSPFSRARGWLKKEVEHRRLLRAIALEFFGIDDNQPNWRDRYISQLEQLAFPAFKLDFPDRFPGRPAGAEDLHPLFVVMRLEFSRDGDGRLLPRAHAALLLAREHLGIDAPVTKVEQKARYFVGVRKRYWKNKRTYPLAAGTPKGSLGA